MFVDLHAHYPMHVMPEHPHPGSTPKLTLEDVGEAVRYQIVQLASAIANYPTPTSGPVITIDELNRGNVRLALSPLYVPLDEMDLSQRYGAPPQANYFRNLLDQLDGVEHEVRTAHATQARIALNLKEMEHCLAKIA